MYNKENDNSHLAGVFRLKYEALALNIKGFLLNSKIGNKELNYVTSFFKCYIIHRFLLNMSTAEESY